MEDDLLEDDEDMIFTKAREFLQLVKGTTTKSNAQLLFTDGVKSLRPNFEKPSNEVNKQADDDRVDNRFIKTNQKNLVQFGALRKSKVTCRLQNNESMNNCVTPQKRRKLERIKAPVTSFVKESNITGVQGGDDEDSVRKMLDHMKKLPEQDVYSPPPCIPMAFVSGEDEEKDISALREASPENREYIYLSSEKHLSIWKMLNSSPTNRNVFVGNLNYKVDESVLKTLFETLVVNDQQSLLTARLVTDPISGVSKGYGFVEFPYRRAAEIAFICLQDFELYGREIRLGWGQESARKKSQDLQLTLEPQEKEKAIHTKTTIEWLSRKQRVHLIKVVCENLRKKNVAGHLGVFNEYFEPDNSELISSTDHHQ